ncbi:MAG TPA: ribonuclease HII [Chloroflexaceae bacterium]|nr:ribonuclease HII [Chloroflexaceae bacterium]
MPPTIQHEAELLARGHARIAGLDEAGRGCWAGPVVAAAVVLGAATLARPELLEGVDDSKQLTAAERERGYARVLALAEGVGVGVVPAYLIDAYGIVPATRLAMVAALLQLPCAPQALLIDALPLPQLRLPQAALIKGDSRSLSIAAASLVAKVTRDRLMSTADLAYPAYGFGAHKGYGTPAHQRALARHGPCALHRRTFAPLLGLEG